MFITFKQKLILGIYIFVILSIPIGAYLVSQIQNPQSNAQEGRATNTTPSPSTTLTPKEEIKKTIEKKVATSSGVKIVPNSPSQASDSPTIAKTFGPTLSLQIAIEGRPKNKYASELFLGLMEGSASAKPKFLLSFAIKIPDNGTYANLSLAGLESGKTYTALLKGQTQIAKAVSFKMAPAETKLNGGTAISLISGDLNEDNTVNSADIELIKKSLGSAKGSANWNAEFDLNLDNIINIADYTIVSKNLGKTGDTDIWVSPIPAATSSAQLSDEPKAIGSPNLPSGHWVWVPNLIE